MSIIQSIKRHLGLEPIEEKLQRFEEIQKSFAESDLQLDELAKDFFIEKSMYEARMKEPDNYIIQPKIQEKFDIFIKGHKESIRKAKKQFDSLRKERDEIEKAFSNHKYIRKEPDGKGGWNYVYEEGEKKEKEVNFKYSLEVNGIDFVTNHSQTYANENLSPFESRGSFKATIRKSDLINIATESEALSSLGITYDDSIKSVCEKLKKKGIHQIEIFKNKLVFEMRPIDLLKSLEDDLQTKKETAYEKIKKAYQHGKISLDSFNTIIKGLTKDEKTKYADFLLFNEEGKLLLLKRSSWEDDNAGAWVIPGGHVDPGEDFKTAAIRELQEESGYNVEDAENVGSYEDDKCHIEYFQAYVNTSEKPIALQFAEVRDYKWIPVNEICEEAMVFNMRDNVLKILGIEDQDKHKKIIRKAILDGIIPVELIEKATANIGEVRIWADGEYKKVSRGKWVKVAGEKEKQLAASGTIKKIKQEIDLLSANFQNEKNKFERSLDTNYRPGSIQYKVFFERAWYNEFENNPTLQKIKQDQSDLNKEIVEINEQIELDKKQERETLVGKKEVDFSDLSEVFSPLHKLFQDTKKNIREYLPADQVAPNVTFNDYYIDTEADFDLVLEYSSTSEIKDGVEIWKDNVREEWEKMKESGKYEFTHSPKSSSQYLIDKETGNVFRIADHWGRCASCYWSNLWERDYGIGVCNLKDFTRRSSGSWFNPEFREKIVEASKISLDELRSLVSRNDIYFTDKAKERISSFTKKIFNDELKRSAFLNEEQLNKFKEDYIDLLEERYLNDKKNLKKAILSGSLPVNLIEKAIDKYKLKLERLEARRTDKQYTKEEADYVDNFVDGDHSEENSCDRCSYYQPKAKDDCVKVIGGVSHNGHCKFWERPEIEKGRPHKYLDKKLNNEGKFDYIYSESKKEELNNYEKIKDYAKRIIEGREQIKRLSPEEERGRIRSGRANVEGVILIGTNAAASDGSKEAYERRPIQEQLLEEYAKASGLWIDHLPEFNSKNFIDSGAEAKVYKYGNNKVIKINNLSQHEEPVEFLDRIAIHNFLFPDTYYEVVGFMRNEDGDFCTVVKQPFIEGKGGVERQDVVKEMEKMGFAHEGGNSYRSNDYLIDDLHKGNILNTKYGYAFIDPIIYLNKKEDGYGGDRELGTIELPNTLQKAYLLGLIPDDLIEKAWKKQPIGTVTTRKDGQQYRKVAETGNMDQDWKLVTKDKDQSEKPESKGNGETKQVKGGDKSIDSKELEIHAKNASESTLQSAIHESADENVRTAAHNEIDRRSKEEAIQEETEKETKEKPIKKGGFEQWL